ncbi:MAG: hypothetical protein DRH32_02910 [Deltaproteobacteria bacterium]|nr:MAG: hypothetical protein DRH32_02910 [Deltaproteobacteria bacterium]
MKDKRGLYYYPFPQNKRVRMYVDQQHGEIVFRMWNEDDAELWEEHGWVAYRAIKLASEMYGGGEKAFDPDRAYDMDAARALIREDA